MLNTSKLFFEHTVPSVMVAVGVVGVVDVKEVVVEGVVVTGSKKILRFVRVLIPSKFYAE